MANSPLAWLGAGILLSAFARVALVSHWPLPSCFWRKLTGVPCLTCGCTRSLAAWADLDLLAALRWNPLFFLVCVGALAWLFLKRFDKASGIEGWVKTRWRLVIVFALLNWLYLWLTLPN